MENNVVPAGSYRIIIADLKNKKIIVDERTVCIVGAFATLDETGRNMTANCMAFSKYTADVAMFTSNSAEEAALRMRTSVHKAERNRFLEKVKRFFKKRRNGDGKD